MTAILAWFAASRVGAAVTGPWAKALGIAAGAGVVLLGVLWGIHWLRADAAADRDRVWEVRLANARIQAFAQYQARVRRAAVVAAENLDKRNQEIASQQKRSEALETAIAALKGARRVAYSKEIAARLVGK